VLNYLTSLPKNDRVGFNWMQPAAPSTRYFGFVDTTRMKRFHAPRPQAIIETAEFP